VSDSTDKDATTAEAAEGAGTPGEVQPAGPTLLEIAAERHRTLQAMLAGNAPTLSPDDVHDLRVAARRLTEVVGLFEPLMESTMAEAAEGSLKDLRQSAGELRDLDVMEEHLAARRLPGPVKHVSEAIRAELPARRETLERAVAAARGTASVSGAMVYLARLFEMSAAEGSREVALTKLAAALAKRAKRRRKQLKAAFGKAASKQSPEALHAARIATKKLRYVLELGHESGVHRAGTELALLKKIQKVLGDHHDVHVIIESLETHLPTDGSVKNLRTAWNTYKRKCEREQAGRAADFFGKSYLWNQR
jgi:CHAD domain-containing protein